MRRVIFSYPPPPLFLKEQEKIYDELIILVQEGSAMLYFHNLYRSLLHKPFYLLPISHLSPLRWRCLCPSFEKAFGSAQLHSFLRVPVESCEEEPRVQAGCDKKRGLFITKAQPLHRGHVAILDAMAKAVDEIIVVIAMGQISHTSSHIATGGERLSMLLPFLKSHLRLPVYVTALPYEQGALEHFHELEYLLPPFHAVYTNNPSVACLAETAGYPVCSPNIDDPVSSTLIREKILADLPYKEFLPPSIYDSWNLYGIPKRLKILTQGERRCVG